MWVIEDPAVIYVGECFAYVLLYEFYSFWKDPTFKENFIYIFYNFCDFFSLILYF